MKMSAICLLAGYPGPPSLNEQSAETNHPRLSFSPTDEEEFSMRQTLDETLNELHNQLAEVEDLDQEHVDMLRTALTEIQETLDEQNVSSATLAERLKDASQQFSSSHPLLTNTIGRVADLLSQMGI